MKNTKSQLDIGHETSSVRSYPGQVEGDCIVSYLNYLPRVYAEENPFLRSVIVLRKLAQAVQNRSVPAVDHLRNQRRGVNFAYNYLISAALPTRLKDLRVRRHKEGLLLEPTTPKGRAAMAVLVLDETGRVDRVRQCLRCGTWFYARFNHQQFCSDSATKCQWAHYHSSGWRKQNRERNRKHQAEHRKRLFD
jgi:hypothetical protein